MSRREAGAGWGERVVLALLLWLFAAGAAAAEPKFPPLTGRVVDEAAVLSPQTEAQLGADLAELERQTGRQLVVATVSDLQGYEIEEYGYRLGRVWGIGRSEADDGAILLVAPNEQRVRIEVGYGLEPVLTDALSSVILHEHVLPAFREGRLEEGVVAGTRAIRAQLALPEAEARARAAAAPEPQVEDGGIAPVVFIAFIVLWLLSGALGGGRRRRRRGGAWWLLPILLSGGGRGGRGGGFGGGGFSGGGGSFGGGGASGRW